MNILSVSRRPQLPGVTVEYDSPTGRASKQFDNAERGRRFYIAQSLVGKNPKVMGRSSDLSVVSPVPGASTMSDTYTIPGVGTATTTPAPVAKKRLAPKAKKTAVKPSANGRAKKEGLRKPQVRILQALKRSGKPLTRAVISEKAPADLAMLNSYIGSLDNAIRTKNDKKVCPSLLTLKAVRQVLPENEGDSSTYEITATGRKMLEQATA